MIASVEHDGDIDNDVAGDVDVDDDVALDAYVDMDDDVGRAVDDDVGRFWEVSAAHTGRPSICAPILDTSKMTPKASFGP